MTDYKPGQLAKATVRGVPDVTVFRAAQVHEHHVYLWDSDRVVDNASNFKDEDVTDVRPLVVLDLAAANDLITADEVAEFAIKTLRRSPYISDGALADQIEAQTRPAIEEPKGLGAVVEDRDGTKWVRTDDDSGPWHGFGSAREPYWRNWRDINAVRVLSEGVQP